MELIVEQNLNRAEVAVFVKVVRGDKIYIIGQKDGVLIEQHLDRNNPYKQELLPLFKMSAYFAVEFWPAVLNYLSNQTIVTKNEHQLQGHLEATREHLSDTKEYLKITLEMLKTTMEKSSRRR